MLRRRRNVILSLILVSLGAARCIPVSDADWLNTDRPRAGRGIVVLLDGWMQLGSSGMHTLTTKLTDAGLNAQLYHENQWRDLSRRIRTTYLGTPHPGPLVLIGHSYGADNALEIARRLDQDGIAVALIVTLDPVTPPKVPANVKRCINIYQRDTLLGPLPWFRGTALENESLSSTVLANWDLGADRRDLREPDTDHFSLTSNEKIHSEIIARVMETLRPTTP
ncbi:MAG: thioesterase domain-containing protein [Candidatus Rokuibacteriota bacterium]